MSEFYADYGTYDVTVTTPATFTVGAVGRLVSETPASPALRRAMLLQGNAGVGAAQTTPARGTTASAAAPIRMKRSPGALLLLRRRRQRARRARCPSL
ncbi:MAG: hypothetical protein R3B70_40620 [Polyangiaceae bacterium]